jgi:hypothetical protein
VKLARTVQEGWTASGESSGKAWSSGSMNDDRSSSPSLSEVQKNNVCHGAGSQAEKSGLSLRMCAFEVALAKCVVRRRHCWICIEAVTLKPGWASYEIVY